jgi:hypothetical protein
MAYQSMMAFAESWIARRDVDAVLAHYADTAQFISPLASNFVDRPILCDKKELEDLARSAGADLGAGIQT